MRKKFYGLREYMEYDNLYISVCLSFSLMNAQSGSDFNAYKFRTQC